MIINKTYQQLNKDELYAISKLRQDIFIVEQNSVYIDLDSLDQQAIHYLLKGKNQQLLGYARYRVLEADNKIKIERVVLVKECRGKGQGKLLMQAMLADICRQAPDTTLILSAQLDVCQFYGRLGFKTIGEPYDDGGIAHIGMQYKL